MAAAGLQTHIWNNNLRSIALLALYPVLILAMVWAGGAVIGVMTTLGSDWADGDALGWSIVAAYWPLILTVIAIWFMVSYFFHGRMVRAMAHSHPVTRTDEPELYNLFENLCIAQGVKTPRLEIIETHARNAFASGIDDKSYCVTVTRGLLQSLQKDEVEAVLAHELTHIQNRDVRLLIISVIFTGMIGFAAQMLWSSLRYSLWAGSHRGRDRGNGMLLVMALLGILWVGYILTLFTRFALSRRREYMADAGAVSMTKNPEAMMRALQRIAGMDAVPAMPGDIKMMCIENAQAFLGLLATHPPIERRIQAISETTRTPIPAVRAKQRADDRFASPWDRRDNWLTRQRFSGRRASPWG